MGVGHGQVTNALSGRCGADRRSPQRTYRLRQGCSICRPSTFSEKGGVKPRHSKALRPQPAVPYATLSLTLGKDRKLYYGAAGREFDYAGSAGVTASHLTNYDLATGRIEDLGEMRLADGIAVIGTNSATTGPDGTIYFGGAIEVKPQPGKPVEAGGKVGDVYYRLAIIIYHPPR